MPTDKKLIIERAIAKLIPLYSEGIEDSAEQVLHRYPNPHRVVEALEALVGALLPGRMLPRRADACGSVGSQLSAELTHAWDNLIPEIAKAIPLRWYGEAARCEGKCAASVDVTRESERIMEGLFGNLSLVRLDVIEDIKAAYEGDPAALTYAEVKLAYPGLLAITSHRVAHELYKADVPVVPRIMSEWTHAQTGADIHPGAQIGKGFFIDHATGVVIGETTKIGNRVKLYQGVTLGAKSFPLDEQGRPIKHVQRHPTVENNVVVYANATILGGDTVIGAGSTVGGNVFLMESVPAGSFVRNEGTNAAVKPAKKG